MENVSTGVLEKIKNITYEVKIKPKNYHDVSRHIQLHMPKYKKNEDILSIMSNLLPNCCLKVDFQKVDQHAGGKWLIHDSKRCKGNHLQSLKLPCRISKLTVFALSIWNLPDIRSTKLPDFGGPNAILLARKVDIPD